MKKLLILLLCLSAVYCNAQNKLSASRTSSYYTYIYKISDSDLLSIYNGTHPSPTDKMLGRPVDSVKTDSVWSDKLPAGNYVKVHADKNALRYDIIEKHSAFIHVMNASDRISFIVTDRNGNTVTNATVKHNNKIISPDTQTGIYSVNPSKRNIFGVRYAGVTNFFKHEKSKYRPPVFLTPKWFKNKWYRLKSRIRNRHDQRKWEIDNMARYAGFMAFNKPKYKPNDTVKLKAYIVNKKNKKPLSINKLLVQLHDGYRNDDPKTIGTVTAYRAGAYEFSFVLDDSLDLDLDDDYRITLADPSKFKKNSDGDDEKTHHPYLSGSFTYEEYELKSITFNMRTDKVKHTPGMPLNIFLKATDENDLPVPDGRIDLLFKKTTTQTYRAGKVFVPDTLWRHTVKLDPVGETKVTVPDSIFPPADIDYTIYANFNNSSNEHREQTISASYNANKLVITTVQSNDTLKIAGFTNGKTSALKATVFILNSEHDTTAVQNITLPASLKINMNAAEYIIKADSLTEYFNVRDNAPKISISGHRKHDSLYINVNNPGKLSFWYEIYSNKKLIKSGVSNTLNYKDRYTANAPATCLVHYFTGGKLFTARQVFQQNDKLLNVDVKQPLSIYPGQRVKTTVEVTDAKGRPAANTDVTAWAITSKFENYNAPQLPYLGKLYPLPNWYSKYQPVVLKDTGSINLNWHRRSKDMGLDSIEYYRFTHPDTVYRMTESLPDTLTQIAPFLVKNGDILPIHILYIDERPVYFSQADQFERYSFAVKPGKHKLEFRTAKHTVYVQDVMVEKNKRQLLSFNAGNPANLRMTVVDMPDTLYRHEAQMLDKYMITVAKTFSNKLVTIEQDEKILLLNPVSKTSYKTTRDMLIGPLADNYAQINIEGDKPLLFLAEPTYVYTFAPGLLRQKSIKSRYPFNTNLNSSIGATDYTQKALTKPVIENIWRQYLNTRSRTTSLFVNDKPKTQATGFLTVNVPAATTEELSVKNIIIYRYDDPDFIRVYPGSYSRLDWLDAGRYRLFLLLKNDSYHLAENIIIKPYGDNYYSITPVPRKADSVSFKINKVITARSTVSHVNDNNINNDVLLLKEAFNQLYLDRSIFTHTVTGIVSDNGGHLPGATVAVKGAPVSGVFTDMNGHFTIRVPSTGKLVVKMIGYLPMEVDIRPGNFYTIKLESAVNHLDEVVVVGFGAASRKTLTGAISTVSEMGLGYMSAPNVQNALAGRLPGFFSQQSRFDASDFFIRGVSSVGAGGKPLIVVDGEMYTYEQLQKIDVNEIEDIAVLKDAAATAIYGTKGANGVLVVTTKKGRLANMANAAQTEGTEPGAGIRKNFSDYAYWQPRLTTDANGRATFTTVMPDDITNWRNFFIAVSDNKETGYAETALKSFKPLSASFISPQFAVKGDKLSAIGKVMNYGAEPARVNRTFVYNGKTLREDSLTVTNSKIDTLQMTAADTDSLTFAYSIKRGNGYFDGEERKIPVIEQGVQETIGHFEVLRGDTAVNLKFDAAMGTITLRAEASALPTLIEETNRLRDYRYLCNEQLASKLKGLLTQKRIKSYLGQPFTHDNNVKDVIKKLQENRGTQGLWGWWQGNSEELWISQHAVEALIEAEKQGYAVKLDKQKITDYLVYQLESYNGRDKIACLELLFKMGAKVDYKKYAEALYKERLVAKPFPDYNKFRIMILLQQAGVKVDTEELLNSRKTTMFGNVYWGQSSYNFFDNSVQLSLLAYRIFKHEGKHPEILERITGYLLEQRREGNWRNTYEASLILETVLPELLAGGKKLQAPTLTLSGAKSETVSSFPYSTTFTGNQVTVNKKGTLPVYLTGYQQFWNTKPQKVSKDFTVDTWFEKSGPTTKLTKLKGGEKVTLKAEVTARADGEYVMVEIPIPAGCSYENKEQAWWGSNEVHREYFKEKVSIFCRKLKQGKHTFTITLMPRFNGEYTLNPAKAELMYFPVFYGREGMRQVTVGE